MVSETCPERQHLNEAVAALCDRHARPPVFWSERVEAALAGKSLDDQLLVLAEMIQEAVHSHEQGYGPAECDLTWARRKYLALHEQWAAERLPSQERAA